MHEVTDRVFDPQEGDILRCPIADCPRPDIEVSTEDPDASLATMLNHLMPHVNYNQSVAMRMLRQVKLMRPDGK